MTALEMESIRESAARLDLRIEGAHSATIKSLREGIVQLDAGHLDLASECFRFASDMAAFQHRELKELENKLRP